MTPASSQKSRRTTPEPDLWQSLCRTLEGQISAEEFTTYIKPLWAQQDNGRLVIYAPNRYFHDEFQCKYLPLIRRSMQLGNGHSLLVDLVEVEIGGPSEPHPRGPKRAGSPNIRASQASKLLNSAFTFETFTRGECNQWAHDAALKAAANGASANPLLMYGSVGVGKTHLAHAIGHRIHQRSLDTRVVYCHGQLFLGEMVDAFRRGDGAVDRKVRDYLSADVLLFDDIHFIAGAPATQGEFFKILNRLLDTGRQIVVTCRDAPNSFVDLDDAVKSRLNGGLSLLMSPPDKATAVNILMKKARVLKVTLSEQVAQYICGFPVSSVRDLEGALHTVAHSASAEGVITKELAQKALLRYRRGRQVRSMDIDRILDVVSAYYRVSRSDMLSKRRFKHLVRARHVAMSLIRDLTDRSYADIGQAFGKLHHTTVKSACDKIAARRKGSTQINEEYLCLLSDARGW